MVQTSEAQTATPVEVAPALVPDFCWEFVNGIDAKSRVVLPAPFRAPFESGGGRLTIWNGPCLAAWPTPQWQAWVDRFTRQLAASREERPDAILREVRRTTTEVKLDIQGRFTLPDSLRAAAGIGTEVRFVGAGLRVELWPAEVSSADEADRSDWRDTISLLQSSFDVPLLGAE